ncbi:MAG: hypothetical protein EBY21_13290, partial [Alphaproteobacteria bacterium]|nr:hypothetical protein [Alphaproteobacteria bacterium]
TLHALKQRAHLQSGESLAILGASGGVGLAAIELGRLMGATIIACASSQEKLDFAKKAGADVLIDYSHENWREGLKSATQGRGVDVIYDAVGGAHWSSDERIGQPQSARQSAAQTLSDHRSAISR